MTKWWQKLIFIVIPVAIATAIGLSLAFSYDRWDLAEITYAIVGAIYLLAINFRWSSQSKKNYRRKKYGKLDDDGNPIPKTNEELMDDHKHFVNTCLFWIVVGINFAASLLVFAIFIR